MMRWEIGQCEIVPNEWYEKKKELIDIEKDAQKGKMIDMKKKMPKWEKNVMRMMNGLPIINLPIYTT